jgi:hypothetical protein
MHETQRPDRAARPMKSPQRLFVCSFGCLLELGFHFHLPSSLFLSPSPPPPPPPPHRTTGRGSDEAGVLRQLGLRDAAVGPGVPLLKVRAHPPHRHEIRYSALILLCSCMLCSAIIMFCSVDYHVIWTSLPPSSISIYHVLEGHEQSRAGIDR